jgi:hypothetical protein
MIFHAGNGTAGTGTDNGNVWGIYNYRDRNRDQSFTYDPLNRLLSAQNAGTNCATITVNGKTEYWGNSYSYDAWGNLLGKTITKCGAEHLTTTADAHNWIHATAPDYQYDAAGNMTFDATSSLNYSFDQENRITGAAGYTYTYDGDGSRVRKSNGNTASSGTLYWYMAPSEDRVSYHQCVGHDHIRVRLLPLGRRAPVRQQRLQRLQIHRQKTRRRNRPRLLRRALLLERTGALGFSGLERNTGSGAVRGFW